MKFLDYFGFGIILCLIQLLLLLYKSDCWENITWAQPCYLPQVLSATGFPRKKYPMSFISSILSRQNSTEFHFHTGYFFLGNSVASL